MLTFSDTGLTAHDKHDQSVTRNKRGRYARGQDGAAEGDPVVKREEWAAWLRLTTLYKTRITKARYGQPGISPPARAAFKSQGTTATHRKHI